MVALGPASVVVIPFPFSDLSGAKLRPAVVLAATGQGDWLLCQITSKAPADALAIRLTNAQMSRGQLNVESYARPMKLFTANVDLIVKRVAILNDDTYRAIVTATIDALQQNLSD